MVKTSKEEQGKIDPRVRDVLILLGAGVFLAASVIMPGLPLAFKPWLDYQKEKKRKEWEKFNLWRLRQVIKRLEKQKMVEIKNGEVTITNRGRQKVLKYNLEEMELKRETDGKWRLIIYDIANLKTSQRELFRSILKRLQFLRLQKSVYLTPFVCDDEIEYLRQTFNIGKEVMVLKVSGIENEEAYRNYFGF